MTQLNRILLLAGIVTAFLGVLPGCTTSMNKLGSPLSDSGLEFTEASVVFEQNATDGDAEIVVFAKGGDEGLSKLRVYGPGDKVILDFSTQDRKIGLREFTIETAEPGIANVINAYPEGAYRFEGVSISGIRLYATASLSHTIPTPPSIRVDKIAGIVSWSSTEGAAEYSLELEKEVDDEDEMKLTIDLPANVTSFSIPKTFLVPGEYQVGIAVHGNTGNIVVVEQEFSIGQ